MNNNQCKSCNKMFLTSRGLSTHFQHNKECKLLHYELFVKGQVSMEAITSVIYDNQYLENIPQKSRDKQSNSAIAMEIDGSFSMDHNKIQEADEDQGHQMMD